MCLPQVNVQSLMSSHKYVCYCRMFQSVIKPHLVMPSVRKQLQEQLQQKHQDLHDAILRQQDELKLISQQLMFVSQMAGGAALPLPPQPCRQLCQSYHPLATIYKKTQYIYFT